MQTLADEVLSALVERGVLTHAQASLLEREVSPADSPPRLARLRELHHRNFAEEPAVVSVLAEVFAIEAITGGALRPQPDALQLVTEEEARLNGWLPIAKEAGSLVLGIIDPLCIEETDTLGHRLGLFIDPRLVGAGTLDAAIAKAYGGLDSETPDSRRSIQSAGDPLQDLSHLDQILQEEMPAGQIDLAVADGPIERYMGQLISLAVKRRASDIHMEPLERRFRVRFRVDGRLQEIGSPPKRLQPSILSRAKLMAGISIAEKRLPQDGRIRIVVEGKDLDLRVSTVPTVFGESIVMRILDKEGLRIGLPELGFLSDDEAVFKRLITLPDGIFLVTGPTGSGKSTTLYSALHHINKPDRKIITVEDPVEYQLAGVNQVQVRREVGMTFAAALRAMLRQAPNTIMVGEIRDLETAEIAVNASLTGHMVYSTLHTNDAPSAVSRLIDIGVKPFLVAASLRAAMAQRLVRMVCPECAAPDTPDERLLRLAGVSAAAASKARFQRGTGCPACAGRGYRGRRGIFEIFEITEAVQQLIYDHASLSELRQAARAAGMRTMREDGIRKAITGLTTLDEVLAVTVADPANALPIT
ncbi:MAG: Flp pilus assembly complex ATPase component TadA [Opitutales bacterium]|nr:Flp pilus assembly complex ATPase component TadA [Opitutales bacterium]